MLRASSKWWHSFTAVTYEKLVIYCDGSYEETFAPPEVFLGDGYCFDVRDALVYAWDPRSTMPVNERWRSAKPLNDPRQLRGTVVVFRVHAACDADYFLNGKK